jgi:hypothetical protein
MLSRRRLLGRRVYPNAEAKVFTGVDKRSSLQSGMRRPSDWEVVALVCPTELQLSSKTCPKSQGRDTGWETELELDI